MSDLKFKIGKFYKVRDPDNAEFEKVLIKSFSENGYPTSYPIIGIGFKKDGTEIDTMLHYTKNGMYWDKGEIDSRDLIEQDIEPEENIIISQELKKIAITLGEAQDEINRILNIKKGFKCISKIAN